MEFFGEPLNRDLISEICKRLDVETLKVCKLVSKRWYQLITDHSFMALYSISRPSISGFFYKSSASYEEKLRYVSVDHTQEAVNDPSSCLGFLDESVKLVNSSNGLLHWYSTCYQQYISNPVAGNFVPFCWPVVEEDIFACGLAFDPIKSKEFEVLVLARQESSNLLKPVVFSSEKMSWSTEFDEAGFCIEMVGELYHYLRGVFLNSCILWETRNRKILVYNMNQKSASLVSLPNMEDFEEFSVLKPGCFGEFAGKLNYCRTFGDALHVWAVCGTFLQPNPNWVKTYEVDLNSMTLRSPRVDIDVNPMILRNPAMTFRRIRRSMLAKRSGAQALAFIDECKGVLLGIKKKVVAYKFDDGSVNFICKVVRNGGDSIHPGIFFPFTHSLALFNLKGREAPSSASSNSSNSSWNHL